MTAILVNADAGGNVPSGTMAIEHNTGRLTGSVTTSRPWYALTTRQGHPHLETPNVTGVLPGLPARATIGGSFPLGVGSKVTL